jgi:hypothetical protein
MDLARSGPLEVIMDDMDGIVEPSQGIQCHQKAMEYLD